MLCVHCKICNRFLMKIKNEHVTSGHAHMICEDCDHDLAELEKSLSTLEAAAVRKIESIVDRTRQEILRLRTVGISGRPSACLEDLEKRLNGTEGN